MLQRQEWADGINKHDVAQWQAERCPEANRTRISRHGHPLLTSLIILSHLRLVQHRALLLLHLVSNNGNWLKAELLLPLECKSHIEGPRALLQKSRALLLVSVRLCLLRTSLLALRKAHKELSFHGPRCITLMESEDRIINGKLAANSDVLCVAFAPGIFCYSSAPSGTRPDHPIYLIHPLYASTRT